MGTLAAPLAGHAAHPVHVRIEPATRDRNRLTVAFRIVLALPHLMLVGAPVALAWTWSEANPRGSGFDWAIGGGVLGAVAVVSAIIAWFAILFTGRYPAGLRSLVEFFLHWRVRASTYMALLRDEYPPLGDGPYAARLELVPVTGEHNRVSVGFRPILIIPQAIAVWLLGLAWWLATIVAWFAILFTGEYPAGLYRFASSALQWTTRVEAYMLLLHDEYPPFSLDAAA